MVVQLKSGYDIDRGPAWICWVHFNRTWKTARFHGRTLRRFQSFDANFYDIATDEWFWLSGPKRDRTDTRGPRWLRSEPFGSSSHSRMCWELIRGPGRDWIRAG